jgi:hypothetical protein
MRRCAPPLFGLALAASLLRALVSAAAEQPAPAVLAVDPLPLRALLVARDFDALEARFAAARSAPDAHELTLLVDVFANLAADADVALDTWRAERPQSAPAQLALARRELERAWEARGRGFANTVDAEERGRMRVHALRAAELAADLAARDALWLDAYGVQIGVSQLLGDPALAERALAAARALDPTHYGVWVSYINLFRRRWGGSYEAQEQVARAAQAHAAANPRLRLLLGAADQDRGADLADQGRHPEALAAYDRALLHGDEPRRLHQRSHRRIDLGDLPGAWADLERALALAPYLAELHEHRAELCQAERDFACLAEATARALELDPTVERYPGWHAWAVWAAENPGAAARALERNSVQDWLYRNGYKLLRHALASAVVATLAGLGYYALRARRRLARESDAAASPITRLPAAHPLSGAPAAARPSMAERLPRTGVLMVRAYVWLQIVFHGLVYSEQLGSSSASPTLGLDLAVTLPALAGALGFAHGWRLGWAWLWRLWALLFPAWNAFQQLQLIGFYWEHWPAWAMLHVPLLPLYAALFAYGWGCPALWAGGRPGPGWDSPRPARRASAAS